MIDREKVIKGLTMPDGTCTSCRFYEPFIGMCVNSLSEFRGHYMPPTEVCEGYSAIEEEEG